jgi:hypothetical protein
VQSHTFDGTVATFTLTQPFEQGYVPGPGWKFFVENKVNFVSSSLFSPSLPSPLSFFFCPFIPPLFDWRSPSFSLHSGREGVVNGERGEKETEGDRGRQEEERRGKKRGDTLKHGSNLLSPFLPIPPLFSSLCKPRRQKLKIENLIL